MNTEPAAASSSGRDNWLEKVLIECVEALEKGRTLDRQELAARYPEFAAELTEFFADRERIEKLAGPLRALASPKTDAGAEAATIGHAENPTADPRVGTAIRYFGDYELLEEIARGGMGVVYKAKQVSLNRIVAVKMILAGQFASAVEVQRFHTEAEAAANLDHPNIVPIYEVGEHEGRHYFSMKLIEGPSLGRAIADCRVQIAEFQKNAAHLMATIAHAIHYAHQRGVIHRDLKPANILLSSPKSAICNLQSAIPSITDFGLAKRMEGDANLSQSGAIVGTPAYMAPEQAAGKKGLTTAADVYSLGAILYELLTGKPPFVGATPMDILLQVMDKEPTPPRQVRPDVDRDLETIALKCLDKDPTRRYSSAETLADDLERWLRGEPIEARPARTLEKAMKWAQRKPAQAALVGTVLTATITLLVVGVIFNVHLQVASNEIDRQKAELKRVQGEAADKLTDANQRLDGAKLVQRRTAFWGDLGRAHRELKHQYPVRASDILDRHLDSDLRGWEWHYLRRQSQSELYSIRNGEHAVVWSAGNLLATCFDNARVITLRDPDTGKIVRTLSRPNEAGPTVGLAFDQAGKRLVSWEYKERFALWDVPSGKLIREWNEKGTQGPVAMRPDGRQLATAVDRDPDVLQLWDADTGKLTKTLQITFKENPRNAEGTFFASAPVHALAYSPDGKRIAMGTVGGLLVLWNTETYEKTGELSLGRYIESLAFDPAGDTLYAMDHGANLHLIRIDPEGKCSKVNSVYLGKVNEGSGFRSRPVTLAVDPRGGRLVTASKDRLLRLWKVRDNDLHLLGAYSGHELEIDSVAFSPDGRRFASLDFEYFVARPIKIWDAADLDVPADGWPANLTGELLACEPDPAGRYLAVARVIQGDQGHQTKSELCDAGTGKVLWEITTHSGWTGVPRRQTLAFSPDSKRLATMDAWDAPPTVRVWDVEKRQKLFELEKAGENVIYSPDGRWIATMGRHDGVLHFWNASTGKRAFSHTCSKKYDDGAYTQYGRILAFTPDSKLLVVGSGLLLEVHDDGLKEVHTFAFPERPGAGASERVGCLAISPDGRYLATSSWPGEVDLWDLKERRLHQKVSESRLPWTHLGNFNNVWLAFTPDSQRLAYATEFGAIHLWDVKAGADVLVLDEGQQRDAQRVRLFFSKDGNKLVAISKTRDAFNARCRWDVWNAAPLADDVVSARLAGKLLDGLAKTLGLKDEIRARIDADADLKEPVRRAVLKQLAHVAENAGELNDLSWVIASRPSATAKEYQLAVRQAERAQGLAPTNRFIRHTLGVAYFRVGEYVKARDAIRQAIAMRPEKQRQEEYFDLAFLAMIHHHLGEPETARDLLKKMRKANSDAGPVGIADVQYRAFLAEAEELIERKK